MFAGNVYVNHFVQTRKLKKTFSVCTKSDRCLGILILNLNIVPKQTNSDVSVLVATSVSSLAVENGGKTFRTCAGHFRLFMGQWYVNFGLLISE